MKTARPCFVLAKRTLGWVGVFVLAINVAIGTFPKKAQAEPMRDFITSCSYGVMAGTLVGAASLAFSDKPGDNLNTIARGASLGLYAGVLLGLYVVYGVPSQEEAAIRDQLGSAKQAPDFLVTPIVGERGIEGGQFYYSFYQF